MIAPGRTGFARTTCAALPAIAVMCALSAAPGCGFAVKHPAVTGGIVAGTLGFATCKLASDSYAACGLVAGGAGAFLGLVAAAALWLGGDGNSAAIEDEQGQPLPEDDQPPMPAVALPPDAPTAAPTRSPASPSSTSPSATPPATTSPPATPPSASPPSTSPPSTSPQPMSPP